MLQVLLKIGRVDSIFLIENMGLIVFLKIIGVQNQFPNRFSKDLMQFLNLIIFYALKQHQT